MNISKYWTVYNFYLHFIATRVTVIMWQLQNLVFLKKYNSYLLKNNINMLSISVGALFEGASLPLEKYSNLFTNKSTVYTMCWGDHICKKIHFAYIHLVSLH